METPSNHEDFSALADLTINAYVYILLSTGWDTKIPTMGGEGNESKQGAGYNVILTKIHSYNFITAN